jgi:solute carrier family 25 phosphate transporter 23/24/25/41
VQIGILPYSGVDIMLFELFKERLVEHYDGGDVPASRILVAGMAASLCAQVTSYPLTLVRTRLQAQGTTDRPKRYSSMTDVIVKTVRAEGYRGLYKVCVPMLDVLALLEVSDLPRG